LICCAVDALAAANINWEAPVLIFVHARVDLRFSPSQGQAFDKFLIFGQVPGAGRRPLFFQRWTNSSSVGVGPRYFSICFSTA